MAILELASVTKVFGGLRDIDDVSFRIEPGQIFGLIGPNGAGKTTLFNVVTGVYRPEAGSVRFDGRSIGGMPPHKIARLGIARTFQNIRLFGAMSVAANVMVAAHHRGGAGLFGAMLRSRIYYRDEATISARALELLEIFSLRDASHEQARSLPYGSQRRLEIARALMLEPKLLLLDEPAAGMNAPEAEQLKEQIGWLRDRFKLTIALVEHNMQVVMNVCEVVHCMDHGESIAHGTPEQVQADPAVRMAYLGEADSAQYEAAGDAAGTAAPPPPAEPEP
jgi:branched-chain amino acid transport system ATP-binding protein